MSKIEGKLPMKVLSKGKVAVLISPGYGAGWSTWGSNEESEWLLFDKHFVEAALRGATQEEVEEIAFELFGDKYTYCGGWKDIKVVWLPVGTRFTVEEYDGSESIYYPEDTEYYHA